MLTDRQLTIRACAVGALLFLGVMTPHTAAAQSAEQLQQLQPQRPVEDSDEHPLHPLHNIDDAMMRLPLAAALGAALALRPRRRGTPPRIAGGRPDADHPRRRRRRDHARRRRQPGARVRHRRCREPDSLSLEDRRPEGCGRHAVRAGGRAGLGRRAVRAGGLRDACSWSPRSGSSSRSSRSSSASMLKIKAGKDTDALRPKIERSCGAISCQFELRASSDEEVCYDVAGAASSSRPTACRTPS